MRAEEGKVVSLVTSEVTGMNGAEPGTMANLGCPGINADCPALKKNQRGNDSPANKAEFYNHCKSNWCTCYNHTYGGQI